MVISFGERRSRKCQGAKQFTPPRGLISYMLYAVAPETIARHQTTFLVYCVPFETYGQFRYLFQAQEDKGVGPEFTRGYVQWPEESITCESLTVFCAGAG